ncbi:MAG: hypothetical protein ABSB76_16095 [Streptosporangiaceae bacterium]|jgi:hypothetical protein
MRQRYMREVGQSAHEIGCSRLAASVLPRGLASRNADDFSQVG